MVLVGPTTRDVKAPCASTVSGVGGKRASRADRKSGMGVTTGGPSVAGRLRCGPKRLAVSPASADVSAAGARGQHPGDATGTSQGGRRYVQRSRGWGEGPILEFSPYAPAPTQCGGPGMKICA